MVMKPAAGRSSLDRSKGDKFEKQKVTLGKKKCTCDFDIKMGTKCSGTAKCDKKCSGTGTVEIGGCSFKLAMKKGKGKISGCTCAAQPTEAPAPTGTGSGSGETPVPMPGSGSGSEPMPPTGGSGSGAPAPGAGEGMQCACKCTCPDGSGECDCDCNCPMTSKAVTCAEGFSKVCPMMEGQCPADMDVMCPNGAMSRMAGGNGGEGSDKGCVCVPDFLMAMVMKPAAGRSSLDRSKGDKFEKQKVTLGKKKCTCDFDIKMGTKCSGTAKCDKKCSGTGTVEIGGCSFKLAVKKGKGKISGCACANGGNGGAGSGSGSGNGGEGAGASRCACVSKGMGGTGPSPPTGSGSGPAPTGSGSGSEPAPPTGSGSGSGPTVAPPSGTTIPNPGGAAQELELELVQSWSQETDYTRTAKVAVPATTAGQKVPVVFHLHGNGGQGNTRPVGGWLGDDCIIVAPDGYERSWNVYTEKSKADDVSFILDLITKIGTDIPAADMNNVNIIGTSNGAALTYRLMIETGADRPFKRAFPMVSSLISPQYHDNQFWASPVSAAPGEANVYDTAVVPVFADDFEYAHFHGTEDGALQYEGQSPGPGFLGGADVIAAQKTDYLWAVAMGYTGAQLDDSAGVSIGTADKPVQEYSYLGGRVRHYKLVGEGHGTGPGHAKVQEIVRNAVLGL